jgi:hypothetical protein
VPLQSAPTRADLQPQCVASQPRALSRSNTGGRRCRSCVHTSTSPRSRRWRQRRTRFCCSSKKSCARAFRRSMCLLLRFFSPPARELPHAHQHMLVVQIRSTPAWIDPRRHTRVCTCKHAHKHNTLLANASPQSTCTRLRAYARSYTHAHIRTHARARAHTHTHIHSCTSARTHCRRRKLQHC